MMDRCFTSFIYIIAFGLIATLLWVLSDVVIHGFAMVSWDFIFSEPLDSGRSGGIFPILVATVWILLVALAVSVPIGLAVAVWLSEYTRQDTSLAQTIRVVLDVLAGVPSIVYGLFGNAFFCVFLGFGYSVLSGGLTLACMILPVFIRTCELGLRLVNNDWRRGALALGMTRAATAWQVIIPAAAPAIVAGLVLGIGRATAETAALIFTSGYVDRQPESILDSGRALAVHVYDLSMNITGGDAAAYGSALILLMLIILFNACAQTLTDYWVAKRSA